MLSTAKRRKDGAGDEICVKCKQILQALAKLTTSLKAQHVHAGRIAGVVRLFRKLPHPGAMASCQAQGQEL